MGKKNHSAGDRPGKGKLEQFAENLHDDDGKRFGNKVTHKGLSGKREYKQKYKRRFGR